MSPLPLLVFSPRSTSLREWLHYQLSGSFNPILQVLSVAVSLVTWAVK